MTAESNDDFKSNEYDGPNQSWICGGVANGLPCPLGPSHRGECRAECTPTRDGDRYYCNHASEVSGACDEGPLPDGVCCQMPPQCTPSKRIEPSVHWVCNRGKCQEGPLPDGTCSMKFTVCKPVRGVLAKRGRTTLAVFGLAAGSILILTGTSNRHAAISPGELTSHHHVERLSENIAGTPESATASRHDCKKCHAAGDGYLVDWVHTAFSPSSVDGQSKLCVACHADIGKSETAMLAHGVSPKWLAERTRRVSQSEPESAQSLLLKVARIGRPQSTQELACATCHEEHQGTQFDMTQMSDLQCQVCHSQTFHSFDKGHPEFPNYPYKRRVGIYFDHMTHHGTHFANFKRIMPNGEAPQSCSACHQLDEVGQQKLIGGFDHMCGRCHSQQINETPFPGLALIALPALDLATIDEKQVPIGEWPRFDASLDSGRTPSPLMQLLLRSEKEFADVEAGLAGIDLRVLHDASPDQLRAVEDYVWAIKKLVYEFAQDGPEAVRGRIEGAVSSTIEPSELAILTNIPSDVFATTQRTWFPNLTAEMEKRSAGDQTTIFREAPSATSPRSSKRQFKGGWNVDDRDYSIRYTPTQHADHLIRTWLEVGERAGVAALSDADGVSGTKASLDVSAMRSVFLSLTKSTSSGRCMKCHTVDMKANGSLEINWHGLSVASDERRFTTFSHLPHISKAAENCTSCHIFDERIDFFREEFHHPSLDANLDPHSNNTNGFLPMQKANCTLCHSKQRVRQSCLTCHNYHVIASARHEDWPVKAE